MCCHVYRHNTMKKRFRSFVERKQSISIDIQPEPKKNIYNTIRKIKPLDSHRNVLELTIDSPWVVAFQILADVHCKHLSIKHDLTKFQSKTKTY